MQYDISLPWTQIEDILLIVVFNSPFYQSFPYVDLLYRSFFPNILYCGPETLNTTKFKQVADYKVSFIKYENYRGYENGAFNYQCFMRAVEMGYKVSGYLVIGDDDLLLLNQVASLPRDKVWADDAGYIGDFSQMPAKQCVFDKCERNDTDYWVTKYQDSIVDTLHYLGKHHQHHTALNKCYHGLLKQTGSPRRIKRQISDIFYIPVSMQWDVHAVMQMFLKHKVFLEFAIPTTLLCLSDSSQPVYLSGVKIWGKERRRQIWKFPIDDILPPGYMYFHPAKWSALEAGDEDCKSLFCTKAVPLMYDPNFTTG